MANFGGFDPYNIYPFGDPGSYTNQGFNYGAYATPPSPSTSSTWWQSRDWQSIGAGLQGLGGMFAGGQQAPVPTGYEWQQFTGGYGPGGGNLNPYADAMYANMNNLWAQEGLMGGLNAFNNQAMPMLSKLSSQETDFLRNQLGQQATQQTLNQFEELGATLGVNSGAFQRAAADTASQNYLQAGLAGEQARLGLLGNWSQQAMQGLQTGWQNNMNWLLGESEAQRVAPTLTPTYQQPNPWNWQNILGTGLQIAGTVLPFFI